MTAEYRKHQAALDGGGMATAGYLWSLWQATIQTAAGERPYKRRPASDHAVANHKIMFILAHFLLPIRKVLQNTK
jgi:hypothetical protein